MHETAEAGPWKMLRTESLGTLLRCADRQEVEERDRRVQNGEPQAETGERRSAVWAWRCKASVRQGLGKRLPC